MNPQAAAVFSNATEADLLAGARKVLAINEATIVSVWSTMRWIQAIRRIADQLVATLLARQDSDRCALPGGQGKA